MFLKYFVISDYENFTGNGSGFATSEPHFNATGGRRLTRVVHG
jgi:hypothetical protein